MVPRLSATLAGEGVSCLKVHAVHSEKGTQIWIDTRTVFLLPINRAEKKC